MQTPQHVLFVCEGNQQRSPTAEMMYRDVTHLQVRSAGFSPSARTQIEETLLEWADIVFVMDRRVERHITLRFPELLELKQLERLDIPDDYDYLAPQLIAVLTEKLTPFLGPPAMGAD